MSREYAFTEALGIAFVDMLPVLGTGAVLIPWSVLSFIEGNVALGIGLAVLYAAITVIRAIAEPKIVGDSIGLSPVLSLMSVYVGFKLFGAVGMILLPIAAAILRGVMAPRLWKKV